jgi:hypothetical protein
MKKLAKLSLVLCLAAPVIALAESQAMPKPVTDMECLVGRWKGKGSLSMGKDKLPIQATWTCDRTAAQFGVLCNFHVTGIPGMPAYEDTDLMGYEPNTNLYHWYSVTNAGETHDHVASVPKGDTISFVFNGTQEGKPFKETIELTFSKDSKHVSGRSETFVAGASTSVMLLEMDK